MGHVGQFPLDPEARPAAQITRGQTVVILTDRGVELGEVLVVPAGSCSPGERVPKLGLDQPRLLRPAVPADMEDARRSEALRLERFAVCQQILEDAGWRLDLIDVEPLLDPDTTVLHVLGPPDVNLTALRSTFRTRSDFDVIFEYAGSSTGLSSGHAADTGHPGSIPDSARRCGDCDCADGGCGVAASGREASSVAAGMSKNPSPSPCGVSSSHSGCASCGAAQWMASKRRNDNG